MKKKYFYLSVILFSFLAFVACGNSSSTYESTVKGHNGNMKISVKVKSNEILSVEVTEHTETPNIADKAIKEISEAIVSEQSLLIDTISGATITSIAIIDGVKNALTDSGADINQYLSNSETNSSSGDEKTIFAQGWSAVPELGILKGDYYKETGKFGRGEGHTGLLEIVVNNDSIIMVEFNEIGRPDYHTLAYADYKRLSDYNFMMGEIQGAAWIQGVLNAEEIILEKQDLQPEIDYVAGATETVTQGLEPLAKQIKDRMEAGTNQKFYRIVEDLGGGITGVLDIVVENGKIIENKYDEVFADNQNDIEDPKLKKYYRTSKYENNLYKDDSKIGFRWQMDLLNKQVVESQDMLNIEGLPGTVKNDDYNKNPSYDNYLKLAEKLHAEMVADRVLS